MLLREFYEHTLPPTGPYTLFKKDPRSNVWVDTLDELVDASAPLLDRTDLYFGVASFIEAGTEDKGRTQANVSAVKCFKLDIDAGEKKLATQGPLKVYPTQQDALRALVAFTKETGLMFSLLVSSGEGLHVYYELDQPLSGDEWQPIAKHFHKFGKGLGLKIDAAVTSNHSGVLRPIGSLHPNGSRVNLIKATDKVYTVDEFANAVQCVREVESKYDTSINDDILPVQGPPKTFKKIIMRCEAMKAAYLDQEHIEEPYWRAAIGVCKHTVEGINAAVAISHNHPAFKFDDVENKFNRWEAGPSTCDTFAEFNADACAGCEHRGKIKSPIQLGLMDVEEVKSLPPEQQPQITPHKPTGHPWDNSMPAGFNVVIAKGTPTLIHQAKLYKEDENGKLQESIVQVPITHDVFWFGQWGDAEDSDDTAQVVMHKMDRHIKRSYLMDQTVIASRNDLTKFLASKGIHLTTHNKAASSMEAYVKAHMQYNKALNQRPKVTDRFGLHILDDGRMICAQGRHVIYPDGRIEAAMLSRALRGDAKNYNIPLPPSNDGSWGGAVWKENILPCAKSHVDFMRKYYSVPGMEKFQLAMMLAISSPLMAFVTSGYRQGSVLPAGGLSIALFSENGGRGKTTAMQCAELAYALAGSTTKDNDNLNITEVARVQRFSQAGTMPLNMDEMGDMEPKQLATLVRTIANGSGRVRGTRDGGIKVSSPWSLICLIGTNRSQREIISDIRKTSSAEQFRLLELDVEDVPKFGVDAQVGFETEWKTMGANAGALGALIHLMICSMGVDKINDLVSQKVAEAARLVQGIHEESASRFQYRALGAMLVLHELLDARGLWPFPLEGLVQEFLTAYRSACDFVDDNVQVTDGLALLSKAIFDFHPETVITLHESTRRKASDPYDEDIRGRTPFVKKARYVLKYGDIYISADALHEWCTTNKVREGALISAARQNNVLLRVYPSMEKPGAKGEAAASSKRWSARYNLLRGMRDSTGGTVRCYKFSIPALSQALGEDIHGNLTEAIAANVLQFPTGEPETKPEPLAEQAV